MITQNILHHSLHSPLPLAKYHFLTDLDSIESDEDIDMKSLKLPFWEFFSIDAVLLAEREMDSDLSLMEIDISEGGISRDSGIQSEPKLSYHDFTLILHDPVVELLESCRKVRGWEDSSSLDRHEKWLADLDREVRGRIGIDEKCSMD